MSSRFRSISISLVTSAVLLTACGGGEQRQVIQNKGSDTLVNVAPVSYTHLTLPTTLCMCRSRWAPSH